MSLFSVFCNVPKKLKLPRELPKFSPFFALMCFAVAEVERFGGHPATLLLFRRLLSRLLSPVL